MNLILRSLKYQLNAHASNLPNLLAGAAGMFVNNVLFLAGMWGMLFASKPENDALLGYYVAMNTIVMTAWGAINFFFGGWIDLADLITNGTFESKLSTPRHPLVLVATHSTHPSALGDLVMGLMGIGVLFAIGFGGYVGGVVLGIALCFFALFGLYVFSGSLAFYLARGNTLAHLIREMIVSLSCYPVGKIFPGGLGRILLLISPAGAVSVLPLEWVEHPSLANLGWAVLAVTGWVGFALALFSRGTKRYQAISVVGAQG